MASRVTRSQSNAACMGCCGIVTVYWDSWPIPMNQLSRPNTQKSGLTWWVGNYNRQTNPISMNLHTALESSDAERQNDTVTKEIMTGKLNCCWIILTRTEAHNWVAGRQMLLLGQTGKRTTSVQAGTPLKPYDCNPVPGSTRRKWGN